MKRILVLAVMMISVGAFAQKAKVTSTYNYLKYDELDKAKEAIDEAALNETTMNYYKTWMFRAQTYARLAQSKDEKYAALKDGAVEEAIKSYKKVLSIDDKKNPKDKLRAEYAQMVGIAYGIGLDAYDQKDYANTYRYWVLADQVNDDLGIADTALVYNIALVASSAGMLDESIQYLDKCIEKGYKGASPYSNKARIQQNDKKDVDGALETLQAGRTKFPNDQALITQELNIYLSTGRNEEALKNLNDAIANDPDNYLFYFARGSIYDNQKDTENAIKDYKKSIELNPEHFDSYFNLGATFFNQGAEMLTEAQMIPTNQPEKYEAAKKAAMEVLEESVPYLEKAHELNPTDIATMNSLKTIYARTNKADKAIEINKKIQAAQSGGQ